MISSSVGMYLYLINSVVCLSLQIKSNSGFKLNFLIIHLSKIPNPLYHYKNKVQYKVIL